MKIEVSSGEVLDKMSILEIKAEKITDETKLKNVNTELEMLKKETVYLMELEGIEELYYGLKFVNQDLWVIEDRIREKEAKKEFDERFIELARLVYRKNDQRAILKKRINDISRSILSEEKSYSEMPEMTPTQKDLEMAYERYVDSHWIPPEDSEGKRGLLAPQLWSLRSLSYTFEEFVTKCKEDNSFYLMYAAI